jgi:hypothetical protein
VFVNVQEVGTQFAAVHLPVTVQEVGTQFAAVHLPVTVPVQHFPVLSNTGILESGSTRRINGRLLLGTCLCCSA